MTCIESPENLARVRMILKLIPFPLLPDGIYVSADLTSLTMGGYTLTVTQGGLNVHHPDIPGDRIENMEVHGLVVAICNSVEVIKAAINQVAVNWICTKTGCDPFEVTETTVRDHRLIILSRQQGGYRINLQTGNVSRPSLHGGYVTVKCQTPTPDDIQLQTIRGLLHRANITC